MSKCYKFITGTKFWYENNNLHRIDGPAIEHSNGTKEWYQNGKHHRIDGPAVEQNDGSIEYWLNDVKLTEVEYFIKIGVINE